MLHLVPQPWCVVLREVEGLLIVLLGGLGLRGLYSDIRPQLRLCVCKRSSGTSGNASAEQETEPRTDESRTVGITRPLTSLALVRNSPKRQRKDLVSTSQETARLHDKDKLLSAV
jgi:hypothetical protein